MAAIDLTYNVSDYYTKLSEACAMLGELYWVDKAVDYLRDLNTLDSRHFREEYTLGTTHPFQKTITTGGDDVSVEDTMAQLQTWADEGATWAQGVMDSLWGMTSELAYLSMANLDWVIESLADVHNSLAHDGDDDFGGLAGDLGVWKGESRDAFVHDWYLPFKDVRSNQCYVLETLGDCFAVTRGSSASAQHALLNAAEGARQALDEQLKLRADNSDGASTKEVLGVISSISGFVGAVSFALPPISATFGIASAATGLAATTIPEGSSETKVIKGASASEIEGALDDQLRQTLTNWRTGLGDLESTEINKLDTFIEQKQDELRLFPRAPGIERNPDPNGFHHESRSQY